MKKTLVVLFILSLASIANIAHAAIGDYCDSKSLNARYFWQQSVTLNGNTISSGNNGGYNATVTPEIALPPGSSTIGLDTGYLQYNYLVYWRGWLDLNGDNQFSTDEQLFETTSRGLTSLRFTVPNTATTDHSTLRIAMKYGSYPQPCEVYSFGETEDLAVSLQQTQPQSVDLSQNYHLTADHDFTLHRTGAIGDRVSWVIERDGAVALTRSAASELQFSYYYHLAGTHIRAWLQEYIDGSYQRVSNIIEYTPGTTDLYELNLESGYQVRRTGQLGDSLTWVIERDGQVVLERSAASELTYIYYNNAVHSKYRVWLKQFINGQYEKVSNTIEYEVGQTEFALSLDQLNQVRRDGQPGDPVSWVVEQDGQIVLESDASSTMTYNYTNSIPGSTYRIWLKMYLDGQYQVVSNIVQYSVPASYAYTLSLGQNNAITRSGNLGDPLTWVVVKDGKVVLQRNAANELTYTYYANADGSHFQVYLTQFIGGYYQRVSNIVEYGNNVITYDLTVDQFHKVTRSGQIGDPAVWVIEEDGTVVLERNAANELSYTYFNNKPGSSYRVWLEQFIDGEYQLVSDIVSYTVPNETFDFTVTLGSGYTITRSGALGDNVNWVIIRDGVVALERNASNELSYTYYRNTVGSTIQVYLEKFIGGYYQQVSNMVQYTVQ